MNQSPEKQNISKEIITTALESKSGIISWQVVQEFINVTTKNKYQKLALSDINDYLSQVLHPLLSIYPNIDIYQKAIEVISMTKYSFYDCLIEASAIMANCTFIFSEQLQHKHQIETTTIINPYK
jgi:predicted nucleic acid-binding protein